MIPKPALSILLLLVIHHGIDSAKILGIFSVPSYSHQVVFQPIWKKLAERGHEMVVITPNIIPNNTLPNLRQIDVHFAYKVLHKVMNFSEMRDQSWRSEYDQHMYAVSEAEKAELASKEVQDLIKNEKDFDLVIVQWMTPIMLGFGAKFRCPMVTVTSLNAYNTMYDTFGNPSHPVIHPEYLTGLSDDMTFWERAQSVGFALYSRWYYHKHLIPRCDAIIKKHIDPNLPYLGEIHKNISMIFTNVNPLVIKPRPNLPTVVEFTGMHIKKSKPLPQDLKDYLDNAKNGVVYMSLGSNVKSSSLPLELREKIVNTLAELPYQVLWKFEDDTLKNKPKNVLIKKWIPQQDIFGHPNVKLFITQGGAQSLEEAIHHKMPLVGFPIFSDQPRNIKLAVNLGIGLGVDPKTVTKEEFKRTIIEVAQNKKYKETIVKLSNRVKDQPMTSLDKVVWWIEYVIRHKGAPHLRSPYADIPLWKYYCLDIAVFAILSTSATLFAALKAVEFLCPIFRNVSIKIKQQ